MRTSQRDDWLRRRTSIAPDWPLAALAEAKGEQTVTVILPALDEEPTVGAIVRTIRRELIDRTGLRLVDELVVLDSGSQDGTAAAAAAAGAQVIHRDVVLPQLPAGAGKGEAMWRGLAATTGDLVVFIDADLRSFRTEYVTGLLGPLLSDPAIQLVKAAYERPLVDGSRIAPAGGGRVTELVARPLLNLHWPDLAGVIQPLSGEYAARRQLLERLPFECGYGVDFGLLIDTYERCGLDSIAQVDLGVRVHRHHDERKLGRMAAEIMRTASTRLGPAGSGAGNAPAGTRLAQFSRGPGGFEVTEYDIAAPQRIALAECPAYRDLTSVRGPRAEDEQERIPQLVGFARPAERAC